MTARDRKLSLVIGFAGLLGAGAAAYTFVLQPLTASDARAVALQAELDEQNLTLAKIARDKPRLTDALKRSLPADPDTAAVEYQAALSGLLRAADIPATQYSLKPRTPDLKAPPLNPAETDARKQTPAYTAVGFDVTLKQVNYATLLKVLYSYHELNLLHQMTKFKVTRRDATTGAKRSGAVNRDLADLDVEFTTTAAILNGAEPRRSLLPVPLQTLGLAGGLGYAGVQQSPEAARNLRPLQFVRVLATPDRDYPRLLSTDMFHGPPPPPPPPPVVPVDPPKEETAEFIRLTGLGRNPDGTGTALIEDKASRNEYTVEVAVKNGRLTPLASKFYYTAKGAKKRLDDPDVLLDISEASSGTARLFRVVGLDDGGLVLASREAKPDAGRKGSRSTVNAPAAAAAGVAAVGTPAETVFVWKVGQPLSQLKPLSARDAQAAVARATGTTTVPTATLAPDDDTGR